jgi:hypothetical protein
LRGSHARLDANGSFALRFSRNQRTVNFLPGARFMGCRRGRHTHKPLGAPEAQSIAPHPYTLESTVLPSRALARAGSAAALRDFGTAEMKAIFWFPGAESAERTSRIKLPHPHSC